VDLPPSRLLRNHLHYLSAVGTATHRRDSAKIKNPLSPPAVLDQDLEPRLAAAAPATLEVGGRGEEAAVALLANQPSLTSTVDDATGADDASESGMARVGAAGDA